MSRSQLKTLSISQIPTSGTSFTYYNTFSVVQEGSDEASRQVLSIEPMSSPIIEDGQTLITSKNFDLTVSGLFKASTISGLQTLADARTSVVFGGIGLGGQILQAEGSINLAQVFSETASFRFNSPREATGGYSTGTGEDGKHTSELAYSTNGLCLYKWGAAAATGTNALAYGWTKSAGTVSFASANGGVQTFSHSGAATLHRDVHLPFDGVETFHFFIDVTNLTDAGNDAIKIKIQSFSDYANTENNSAETVITGTGNKLVGILPPSGSKMLRVSVIVGASDSISFRNPSLHTSAVYNFTEFNT